MKSYFPSAVVLFLAVFPLSAFANHSGIAYEQGSNKKKELYHFQLESTMVEGKEQIKTTWKDLEGNPAIEQAIILDGSKIVRDELVQKQTNQKGLIEVKDGKIFFTKEVDGKSSTKEEKLKDTLVTTANFQKFINDNWEPLANGKEVEFRYGVWDRQETVGFELFKVGQEKIGDKEALVLKMKPSSFVIAMLVKPLILKYAMDGGHPILELNGRIAPKRKDGSSYKDLDAEVVYAY